MLRSNIRLSARAAAALVVTAGSVLLLADPRGSAATAATGATHVVQAGTPVRSDYREYGKAVGAEAPIPISAETETILIDASVRESGLPAHPGYPTPDARMVGCTASDQAVGATLGLQDFTEEEWNAAPPSSRAIELDNAPPDWVPLPTSQIQVFCHSGTLDGPRWGVSWNLDASEQPGLATVVLGHDEDLLTFERIEIRYGEPEDGAPPIPVAEGDRFQVVGAPGTWTVPASARWAGEIFYPNDQEGAPLLEVSTSTDGSTLRFLIPPGGPEEGEVDAPGILRAAASFGSGGPAEPQWRSTEISWGHPVLVSDGALESTTRSAVSHSVASSLHRVRVTAAVTLPGSLLATGSVLFTLDGQAAGTAQLSPQGGTAKATITLPRLPRGLHTVVATYQGMDDFAPSTSPPKTIRVLL